MADQEATLRTVLHSIARQHGYQDYEITTRLFNSGGANYTSRLFHATISGKGKEDLKLFAKVAVMGRTLRTQVSIRLFETEKFVYTQLREIYAGIEERHSVPTEYKLVFPKFYGYSDTELKETIVIEDLSERGFSCLSRFESIDWAYASKAVEEMAKLHALSIAFAKESPNEFQRYINDYKFDPKYKLEHVKEYWKNYLKSTIKATTEENARALSKYYSGEFGDTAFLDMRRTLRRPTLVHSDFRPSNLMHKVHDDGKLDVMLIDYQTVQAGCPAFDLLYFIMTGSDSAFREKYQEKLKEHYYEYLTGAMRRLNLDPDEAYSREDFEYEWNEMLPTSLTMAIFSLPIVTVDEELAPVIDPDTDINAFNIERTSEVFAKRINELVADFRKWGILQRPSSSSSASSTSSKEAETQ